MAIPALPSYFVEIRARCFYLFFSFSLTVLLSYFFSFELVSLFAHPLQASKDFIFTDLPEAFSTQIRICIVFSFYLIQPVILYQIVSFIIPSYSNSERRNVTVFCSFLLFLYLFASCIIFFFLLPEICHFFYSFSIKEEGLTLRLEPKIQEYFEFISKLFFFFLLLSKTPLSLKFLFENKLLTADFLSQLRKSFYLFSVISAAFFSPPDLVIQVLLAFFFITLYELVIWFGFYHDSFARLCAAKLRGRK